MMKDQTLMITERSGPGVGLHNQSPGCMLTGTTSADLMPTHCVATRERSKPPFWTEERINYLRENWEHNSQSAIGIALGTTKNAIAGQVHRMGLPKKRPGRNLLAGKPVPPKVKRVRGPRNRKKPPTFVPETARPVVVVKTAPKPSRRLGRKYPGFNLGGNCRYIIGNAFCGCERVPVTPYCETHLDVCLAEEPVAK